MFADEETRQVQEELRKRHLFFRDIDGRPSLEYAIALKRYQARQGFAVTGVADEITLYSLGIGEPAPPAEGAKDLPDLPVLKSDAALRELRPRPAPVPSKAQNAGAVAKAEIRTFLRRYFDACQSVNPNDELGFYGERVEYYDHGAVDKPYIQNELAVYNQRWPSRKYTMGDSLRIVRAGNNTIVKVRVAFEVANLEHSRKGHGPDRRYLQSRQARRFARDRFDQRSAGAAALTSSPAAAEFSRGGRAHGSSRLP